MTNSIDALARRIFELPLNERLRVGTSSVYVKTSNDFRGYYNVSDGNKTTRHMSASDAARKLAECTAVG